MKPSAAVAATNNQRKSFPKYVIDTHICSAARCISNIVGNSHRRRHPCNTSNRDENKNNNSNNPIANINDDNNNNRRANRNCNRNRNRNDNDNNRPIIDIGTRGDNFTSKSNDIGIDMAAAAALKSKQRFIITFKNPVYVKDIITCNSSSGAAGADVGKNDDCTVNRRAVVATSVVALSKEKENIVPESTIHAQAQASVLALAPAVAPSNNRRSGSFSRARTRKRAYLFGENSPTVCKSGDDGGGGDGGECVHVLQAPAPAPLVFAAFDYNDASGNCSYDSTRVVSVLGANGTRSKSIATQTSSANFIIESSVAGAASTTPSPSSPPTPTPSWSSYARVNDPMSFARLNCENASSPSALNTSTSKTASDNVNVALGLSDGDGAEGGGICDRTNTNTDNRTAPAPAPAPARNSNTVLWYINDNLIQIKHRDRRATNCANLISSCGSGGGGGFIDARAMATATTTAAAAVANIKIPISSSFRPLDIARMSHYIFSTNRKNYSVGVTNGARCYGGGVYGHVHAHQNRNLQTKFRLHTSVSRPLTIRQF